MGLHYEFTVEDQNALAAFKRVSTATKELHEKTESLTKQALEPAKEMVTAFIAAFALEKVFEFGKGLLEAGEKAIHFSEKVGMSVEAVTGLQYAAKQSGVETDSLQTALVKFGKNASQAADGGGKAATSFKQMGIGITDAHGHMLPTNQLLLEVADKFHGMADGADKARLAQELFGKAGADMIPLLNQGSAAMQAEITKGAALSGITQESAEAMKLFSEGVDSAEGALKGIAASIVSAVAPALKSVAEWLQTVTSNMATNLEHARMMEEQAKAMERAELRLHLAEVARLTTAQKAGVILNAHQQEFLSRSQTWIAKENEKLGLTEREIELEVLKASVAAKERVSKETGAQYDLAASKARIAAIEKEIEIASRPKGTTEHEEKQKKGPNRLEEAEKMMRDLLGAQQGGDAKIQAEYLDHLQKLHGLDDAHYTTLKIQLDKWRDTQVQSLQKQESEKNAAQAQQDNDRLQASMDAARKDAEAKTALYGKFYSDQEQQDRHAVVTQAHAYKEAGVDAVEVAKWRESEIAKIEKKYRDDKAAKEEAARQKQLAGWNKTLGMYGQMASQGQQIFANLSTLAQQRVTDEYDQKKKKVDDYYAAEMTAAAGNSTRQAALQVELANKEKTIETQKQDELARVKRKYALAQKVFAIADETIKGAQSVVNIMANSPPTMWPYLMGFSAALTATQIAVTSQQKFAAGGVIGGGVQSILVNEKGTEGVVNHGGLQTIGAEGLAAINSGRSRQEVARLLSNTTNSSQHVTVNIQGVVNERFVADTLMPALNKHMRKR